MENQENIAQKDVGGRPKKSVDLLPENWEDQILELYEEGASDKEIKLLIHSWLGSFSNDLWDRWLKEEDRFSETIKKGKLMSEVWWEKQGRRNLTFKDFNATLWYMNMKNRFSWADSQKIDHTSNGEEIKINLVRG